MLPGNLTITSKGSPNVITDTSGNVLEIQNLGAGAEMHISNIGESKTISLILTPLNAGDVPSISLPFNPTATIE
jgi:hypothetical protein